jgi:hypothetical protein
MAKQSGHLPIQGTVGELNYYKSADGTYRVRRRTSVNRDRLINDLAFARTRENMAEFTSAIKASKLLREGLKALTSRIGDKGLSRRLTSILMSIAKSDKLNVRGLRNVMDGDINRLKGFEFSATGGVSTTFTGDYFTVINRSTGKLEVSIPGFVPAEVIYAPAEATHFQLHAAALEINFETGNKVYDLQSTAKLPLGTTPVPATSLEPAVTPNSTAHLLLFFAIEFWMESNGLFYQTNNKVYNGVVIADVSKA